MQKLEFTTHTDMPNHLLKCEGFYISYNPTSSEEGETALCVSNPNRFLGTDYYILNGDWREAYKKLAPSGYEACKAFFDSKRELFGSFWSD